MGKSYKKMLEDEEFLERKDLSNGVVIFKSRGKYGPNDFRVRTYNPTTNIALQPKHAHIAIDFYGKWCANKEKAILVFKSMIEVWNKKPVKEILKENEMKLFNLPGYDLEYILSVMEWILDQEDINFKGRPLDKQQELDRILSAQNVKTPKGREGSELAISVFCDILNGYHPVEAFIRSGLRI